MFLLCRWSSEAMHNRIGLEPRTLAMYLLPLCGLRSLRSNTASGIPAERKGIWPGLIALVEGEPLQLLPTGDALQK
eukprot:4754164-Karenia_brevis.AAC.1